MYHVWNTQGTSEGCSGCKQGLGELLRSLLKLSIQCSNFYNSWINEPQENIPRSADSLGPMLLHLDIKDWADKEDAQADQFLMVNGIIMLWLR